MNETYEVLIVGAGFAGIGIAIRLQQEGFHDFLILERANEVGGTWRENTYPGVACDVESHLYSYSFEPNPSWTRQYAPQKEILEYLRHCADKYGIRKRIRFGSGVTAASFDERAGMWSVQTSDGATLRARVVVSGSGHALTRPVFPDIKGRESFKGKSMHSAQWDHTYSLEGKDVAVVGTGASAIQIVPSIASKVRKLKVFQRTPPWIIPKLDHAIKPERRAQFARFPALQKLARGTIYWQHELMALGFVVEPRILELASRLGKRYLTKSVRDPVLREKLTPHYTMGCKRVLPSNEYYPAVTRENVELVTDPIVEIREHSIVTKGGTERPVDAIVFATGFEAAEAGPPFSIKGRGGRELADAWKDGIEAYKGMSVTGFPNLFLIIGPNCGLGHSSMIYMMESQFEYIVDAVRVMRDRRLKYVDVRADAQAQYNEWLQARLAKTVWNTGGCKSWYLTRSGKNTTAWPGFTFEYRLRTRRFDAGKYELVPRVEASREAGRAVSLAN